MHKSSQAGRVSEKRKSRVKWRKAAVVWHSSCAQAALLLTGKMTYQARVLSKKDSESLWFEK